MAYPARAEIEYPPFPGQGPGIVLAEEGDGVIVDMRDEPGRGVEICVCGFVLAAEIGGCVGKGGMPGCVGGGGEGGGEGGGHCGDEGGEGEGKEGAWVEGAVEMHILELGRGEEERAAEVRIGKALVGFHDVDDIGRVGRMRRVREEGIMASERLSSSRASALSGRIAL